MPESCGGGTLAAPWALALLLLVLAASSQLAAAGDIISSSKLESCIADGSQPLPQGTNATYIACAQKLIVVLTVDSGDTIASQDLSFQLSCVGSPTGACPCPCNYAADPACTCRDLASTLTVQLRKSPLWASYPLMYLQSFNYKPYESIVRPGAGKCKDGQYEDTPTCGWYYAMSERVVDSQGFACECEAGVIWDSTFGVNTQRTRANLDCDFFSDPLDILLGKLPCSAHCLMMDPHWYGGYSLGEASLQFEISAALTFSSSGDGGSSTGSSSSNPPGPGNNEVLTISPSVPVAVSSNRKLSVKLLGDLAGYTQIPVLSERVLTIPHPKGGQSLDDVFNNRTEWMLLDRSRISFDGSECDKVGTSFTAFRYQPSGCRRAPQVCLSNQLRDILEADRARIAQGRSPLYLVSQYTYGLNSELRAFRAGALSFALPVTGIRSSVVQLEASAESLRFTTNNSPGKILAARMCTFAETHCGGFEASAATGYLHAWLANTGTLAASYTIIVTDCTINIHPVDAQRVALGAGQNGTLSPFRIYVEDDQAVAERSCWLKMLDATGLVTDAKQVVFFTNATAYEEWPSGGLLGNGTGVGNLKAPKNCTAACPNKFDLGCAFRNRCWSNIGGFVSLFAGLAAGAGLLALAVKFGWIASLLQLCSAGGSGLCGSCCGGSSSGGGNARERDASRREDGKQQRSRRSSAAAAAGREGGRGDGKGGGKRKHNKGNKHGRGSRSSIDGSGDGSSPRVTRDSEEDQRAAARSAADRTRGSSSPSNGKCSSTNRRPSAAAAAAAAAAAERRRSRQPSRALSGPVGEPVFAEHMYEDLRQPWGSGAGDNEGGGIEGSSGNKPRRPHSSSGGGSGSRRTSGRMQQQTPWEDSATGGQHGGRLPGRHSGAVAGAAGGNLRRQPSGAGSAAAAGSMSASGGRTSRQVRSSSMERVYGPFESAYGASSSSRQQQQQLVKQAAGGGEGRRPGRPPSAGQQPFLSGGARGFADGFIPAVWNPTYADDNSDSGSDGSDGISNNSDGRGASSMASPPRPMRMTFSSPGGYQQQPRQQQQQRSNSSFSRAHAGTQRHSSSSSQQMQLGYESSPAGPSQGLTSSAGRMTLQPASSTPGSRAMSPAAGPGFSGGPGSPGFSGSPGAGSPGFGRRTPSLGASSGGAPPGQGRLSPQQQQGPLSSSPWGSPAGRGQALNPADVCLDVGDEEAGAPPMYAQQRGSSYSNNGRRVAVQSGFYQQQQEEQDWDPPQQQQQQRVRPSAAGAGAGGVSRGGSSSHARPPGSGYVSDSGLLLMQQQQQFDRAASPSSLQSVGSSPKSSPMRSATPGRAVLQQQQQQQPTYTGSVSAGSRGAVAGPRPSRTAAAAAAGAGAGAAPAPVRAHGVAGVPVVHARAAAIEHYRQQPVLRSPFAAPLPAAAAEGLGRAGSPASRSTPGGSPAAQQQQPQQRRMTMQPQQQQQQQQYGGITAAGVGRGSGPRSPSRRPRSSSSNSSSGLSPTGAQQQQYR